MLARLLYLCVIPGITYGSGSTVTSLCQQRCVSSCQSLLNKHALCPDEMPFLIYIIPLALLHPSGWGPRRAEKEGWPQQTGWLISSWLLNVQLLSQ